MLKVRVCGDFQVERDGAPAQLPPSKKTRALLAFLALEPAAHRRDKLCELFWEIPDDPRQALRWSLSKLRPVVNELGLERLVADRERVRFVQESVSIDLLEARAMAIGGIGSLSDERLQALADMLEGEALEGLDLPTQPEFESWRTAMRESARQLRVGALQALIERTAPKPGVQIGWLTELVAADPYNADAHVKLISALVRAGRLKEAERQKSASIIALAEFGADIPARLEAALRTPHALAATSVAPGDAQRASPAPIEFKQNVKFCKASDGTTIAYASVGEGPPIIKSANWLNHLEYDWESPVWRHIFRDIIRENSLIRYDARGNGLSDWNVRDFSLESQVSDLEAVVDAAQLSHFTLVGVSQGCAISIEYAARHPEKVSRLILYGGYARGWRKWRQPKLVKQTDAMLTLIRVGWGQNHATFRQLFSSQFMPDAPIENQEWFNELQRITTSPENAARLLSALGDVDVRERLHEVKAQTVVIHARHDLRVPFEAGRELAAGIPNARFVTLETRNHLIPETDPEWPKLQFEIEAFLAEGRAHAS